jgi:hypothetical protein
VGTLPIAQDEECCFLRERFVQGVAKLSFLGTEIFIAQELVFFSRMA